MIPPDATPFAPRELPRCSDCDGPLQGNLWRCPPCVESARRAVMRAGPGAVVRPSDLARERERTAFAVQ